jgi:general secretion pathway protein F
MNAPTTSGRSLTRQEAEELALRVASVASAQLPLAEGLEATAGEVGSRRLARGLADLALSIRRGQSLAEALAELGGRIPAPLAALLSAAEKSGHLGMVLEEWSHHKMAARLRWRQLWLALAYPATCVVVALCVLTLLAWYIVPQFRTMFTEFELQIPEQSVVLFWMAEFFPGLAFACLGAVFLLMALLRLFGGASAWYWALSQVPLVGKVWHWSSSAEGLRVAGLLVEQQMPLPAALELAGEGLGDAYVGSAFRSLAGHSEAGMPLWSGMLRDRRLPLSLVPLLKAGQQTGQMPASFRSAAEMLEQRITQRCDLIAAVVPPILFVVLAVIILATFSALILPLIWLVHIGKIGAGTWASTSPCRWFCWPSPARRSGRGALSSSGRRSIHNSPARLSSRSPAGSICGLP